MAHGHQLEVTHTPPSCIHGRQYEMQLGDKLIWFCIQCGTRCSEATKITDENVAAFLERQWDKNARTRVNPDIITNVLGKHYVHDKGITKV